MRWTVVLDIQIDVFLVLSGRSTQTVIVFERPVVVRQIAVPQRIIRQSGMLAEIAFQQLLVLWGQGFALPCPPIPLQFFGD